MISVEVCPGKAEVLLAINVMFLLVVLALEQSCKRDAEGSEVTDRAQNALLTDTSQPNPTDPEPNQPAEMAHVGLPTGEPSGSARDVVGERGAKGVRQTAGQSAAEAEVPDSDTVQTGQKPSSDTLSAGQPPADSAWSPQTDARYTINFSNATPFVGDQQGQPLVKLPASMKARLVKGLSGNGTAQDLVLTLGPWTCTEGPAWKCVSSASSGPYHLEVVSSGVQNGPIIDVVVNVEYSEDVRIHKESIVIETGPVGKGAAIARHQRVVRLDSPLYVDPWTYKAFFFGQGNSACALDVGFGFESVLAQPGTNGSYQVELELENAANRPFKPWSKCWEKTSAKHSRAATTPQPRTKGHKKTSHCRIVLGDPDLVRVSRLPLGYRAAIAFTDHADQSSEAKLRTLLFGASDATMSTAAGGFLGHGLGFTKTVFCFTRGSYSAQTDDDGFLQALTDGQALQAFEAGSHSPSGIRDEPGDFSCLSVFSALGNRIEGRRNLVWIDHQPDTNCEAIANSGWNAKSPWYALPQLQDLGFRYFWSADDLTLPKGQLNMLQPDRPSQRNAILYRHASVGADVAGSRDIWLWSSVWSFVDRDQFYEMYSEAPLNRLVEEDGIHIAHSYLDTYRRKGRFKQRAHFQSDANGRLQTLPQFEQVLAGMEQKQKDGNLWVTGVGPLFDHLIRLNMLEITYGSNGTVVITNMSDANIVGATFYMPKTPENSKIVVNGQVLGDKSQRVEGSRTFVWFDIPGKGVANLRLLDATGNPAAMVAGVRSTLILPR